MIQPRHFLRLPDRTLLHVPFLIFITFSFRVIQLGTEKTKKKIHKETTTSFSLMTSTRPWQCI